MKVLFDWVCVDWACVYKRSALLLMFLIPAAPSALLAAEPAPSAQQTPLLIDVRTPQEYQAGYLKGAVNIEHQHIVDGVSVLTQDKNQRIELYCRSGRRSGIAQKILQNAGYKNAVNLGGFEALSKNHEAVYPQKSNDR